MSISTGKPDFNARNKFENINEDVRKIEGKESVIGRTEIIKYLIMILLKHPEIFPTLFNLKLVCNNASLESSKGVYEYYGMSGRHFESSDITLEKDKAEGKMIDFASKDPSINELIFSNKYSLDYFISSGVEFNANSKVRSILHKMSSYLVPAIELDELSKARLKRAIEYAKKSEKKLVLLANHISHLDAPILDYILTQQIDLGFDPRFVCGAFMYYNRGVRPFTVGFNTLFVYGPKDFHKLISRIPSADRQLLKTFNSSVLHTFADQDKKEAIVLFPYAGRSKKGEDENYLYGCKDKIPTGMKDMLSQPECVYLPFGFNGTSMMFGSDSVGGGGNMLKNFMGANPTKVSIFVGDHFEGGTRELSTIHDSMVYVSKNAAMKRYISG